MARAGLGFEDFGGDGMVAGDTAGLFGRSAIRRRRERGGVRSRHLEATTLTIVIANPAELFLLSVFNIIGLYLRAAVVKREHAGLARSVTVTTTGSRWRPPSDHFAARLLSGPVLTSPALGAQTR
ncbi:hypothetical protein ACIPMW_06710 [Streptomyces sp. NPDC086669]|uniref:hypothetical protein n=1 Tax=Streptomyces sp. NPDC086669 TaxID=3365753 RepID=UPI0038060AD5